MTCDIDIDIEKPNIDIESETRIMAEQKKKVKVGFIWFCQWWEIIKIKVTYHFCKATMPYSGNTTIEMMSAVQSGDLFLVLLELKHIWNLWLLQIKFQMRFESSFHLLLALKDKRRFVGSIF